MADRKDRPQQVVPGYSVSHEIQQPIPLPLPLPMGNEGLSETVFNLLFKDLIACESIHSSMEIIQNEVYGQGLSQDIFERRMCELADEYINAEVTSEDKAVIIRYITAFAKIENNVKANLSALAVPAEPTIPADVHDPNRVNPCLEIIQKYKDVQEMINKWAHAYGVRHSLQPNIIHTPNLDWGKWVTY